MSVLLVSEYNVSINDHDYCINITPFQPPLTQVITLINITINNTCVYITYRYKTLIYGGFLKWDTPTWMVFLREKTLTKMDDDWG